MVELQRLIVRVYLAMDSLRNSDAFALTEKSRQKHVCVIPPHFPCFESGSPFAFKANVRIFNRHFREATPALKGF
eukprot:4472817-Karenia_brevis.AAC.1